MKIYMVSLFHRATIKKHRPTERTSVTETECLDENQAQQNSANEAEPLKINNLHSYSGAKISIERRANEKDAA